jgi:hypothetical protein
VWSLGKAFQYGLHMTLPRKIDLFYLSSSWVLLACNVISLSHYLHMQGLYYIVQVCLHRKYVVHHLVVASYFLLVISRDPPVYLAVITAVFQGIIALLLLAKEYRIPVLFNVGMGLWFGCRIVAHLIFISVWWKNFTPLEMGLNLYIWAYSVYSFFHILSTVLRFEDGRLLLLSLLARKQKCKIMWVTDLEVAKQVLLHSSNKGTFIEDKIATPAWSPVLSLESVNGQTWKILRINFGLLLKHLPSAEALSVVTQEVLSKQDPTMEMDAKEMTRLTLATFVKWLFDRDWDPKWNFVCEASWEWRKEIAIKGKADPRIKKKTVDWLVEMIQQSKYGPLFGEKWAEPEYYSVIMQPFILSPMINFSDIAVSAARYPEMSVPELIHTQHPFPILERYIEKEMTVSNEEGNIVVIEANTQVFIPLDTIGKQKKYINTLWTPFSIGPRKCMGTSYALAFLEVLLPHCKRSAHFVPHKNHRYSGRNNDTLTFRQSMYQLFIFVRVLIWG